MRSAGIRSRVMLFFFLAMVSFSVSTILFAFIVFWPDATPFVQMALIVAAGIAVFCAFYSLNRLYYVLSREVFSIIEFLNSDIENWSADDFNPQLSAIPEDIRALFNNIFSAKTKKTSLQSVSGETIRELEEFLKTQTGIAGQVAEGARLQIAESAKASRALREIDELVKKLESDMQDLSANAEGAASATLEMSSSIDHIGEMAVNLDRSLSESSSSLEEMSFSFKQVFGSILELTNATKDTSSSIESIANSIEEVENSAAGSAQLAQETALSAEEGSISVEESTKGMAQIDIAVKDSARIIRSLSDRSDRIGEILNIIDDIADQTNLLALNASIIAAQSGEQGKSFAVVAQQIRQLAEKTALSTKEIAELIASVQQEAEEAVRSMEVGTEAVERGVRLSNDSSRVLKKISECAQRTEKMISKISEATAKQIISSGTVKNAMGRVKERVSSINRAMEEHEKARKYINEVTDSIGDLSNQLKKATNEQTKGTKSINEVIVSIADRIQGVYELAKCYGEKSRDVIDATRMVDDIASGNSKSVEELHVVAQNISIHVENLKKELASDSGGGK